MHVLYVTKLPGAGQNLLGQCVAPINCWEHLGETVFFFEVRWSWLWLHSISFGDCRCFWSGSRQKNSKVRNLQKILVTSLSAPLSHGLQNKTSCKPFARDFPSGSRDLNSWTPCLGVWKCEAHPTNSEPAAILRLFRMQTLPLHSWSRSCGEDWRPIGHTLWNAQHVSNLEDSHGLYTVIYSLGNMRKGSNLGRPQSKWRPPRSSICGLAILALQKKLSLKAWKSSQKWIVLPKWLSSIYITTLPQVQSAVKPVTRLYR